jgi:A/G-specific adenine glycosylase
MEFGAVHCIPKNPPCPTCHFQASCFAAQRELQSVLPRKAKPKVSRKRYFYYFVIQRGKSLLMRKREGKDIWHGLYDFHLVERNRPLKTEKLLEELTDVQFTIDEVEISHRYKHIPHAPNHLAKFVFIKTEKFQLPKDGNLKFYTFEKIYDLPKPVLITRFLSDYKNFYS